MFRELQGNFLGQNMTQRREGNSDGLRVISTVVFSGSHRSLLFVVWCCVVCVMVVVQLKEMKVPSMRSWVRELVSPILYKQVCL